MGRAHAGAGHTDAALEAWDAVANMDPPAPDGVRAEAVELMSTLSAGREDH